MQDTQHAPVSVATMQHIVQTENANFQHFVMDSAWYGLALPAVMNFFSMFAIRLGASAIELGWMTALPALALLASSMLSDWWRSRYPDSVRAVFWPALLMRARYLVYALVPFLPPTWQVLALILIPTIFALPIGISSIIFLVMLREGSCDQRLITLTSRRLLASNLAVALGTIVLGFWLEHAPFPQGYQIMYLVGFALQAVSLWHVQQIKVLYPTPTPTPAPQASQPARGQSAWRVPEFRNLAGTLSLLFISFYAITPVIPLFLVRRLGASEGFVAGYSLMELVGAVTLSAMAARLIRQHGQQRMVGLGMIGTGAAAFLLALAPSMPVALAAGLLGGGAWALTDISQFGLFSAYTAPENRARYTKAYYQVLSIGSFIGPLVGSTLADSGLSLVAVLALGGALRLGTGILIQRRKPLTVAPPLTASLPAL